MLHTELPPRFPNIGYVGSTYNIFKGNPRSTAGLDPGFTLRNIAQFFYDYNSTTADGRYSIPDNVYATTSSTCSFDFSSETHDSISSYYNSLKVDVRANFGGYGASFSASADYKEVHENSESHEYRYVSSHAICEAYIASVQVNETTLNPAFKKAVESLPSEPSTLEDYMDFIQHWGTHAVVSLTMGGRYGVQSSVTNDDYATMKSTGLDIKVAAKYSGVVSLNANAATSIQKKQAKKFESHRTDYQIYQIGGKPPLSETLSTFEWARTVKNNPLPLLYSLLPLTYYLRLQFIPDDKDILKKYINLKKALVEYCQSLDLPDITYCINNGPISTPKIEVIFAKTFRPVPCSPIAAPFSVPKLHDPYYRILGTLQKEFGFNYDPIIVINGKNAPNELIRNAKDWDKVYYNTFFNMSGFRPICDDGFLSVTDILCCGIDYEDCLKSIPFTLPCVATRCLTKCGSLRLSMDINFEDTMYWALITFGNSLLGNHFAYYDGNNFARLSSSKYISFWPPLYECLNFDCLTFS